MNNNLNTNLRKYAFDLAEDYLIYSLESKWRSDRDANPESYVRARVMNTMNELVRHTVEHIQVMTQNREADV